MAKFIDEDHEVNGVKTKWCFKCEAYVELTKFRGKHSYWCEDCIAVLQKKIDEEKAEEYAQKIRDARDGYMGPAVPDMPFEGK